MSDYTSRAVAQVDVNGNAADELQRLTKLSKDLEEALVQAWKSGDKEAQKNIKKQLDQTKRQIRTIQNEMVNVEQTLKRLDKASPKELRQTLRSLEKDLKNIERGSEAWDEHTKKIRAVRTELAKIKAETKEHESIWNRFAKKMFDWGAAIQVVMASITGITVTARKAVQAYAEMEQEMANVRKYTGMTKEQVESLNEEFKKMDTRSSREQLNQLAQEAGRLGMQREEDVMGYVRAADKINVALDELGDGATVTLSKLTNIFGDRERLGVEKSLLAVGSVINELSQNSTAAAPYLTEFASRLGGVGAQAHMTTQQIMGYGAVLDSYNQKVESSSTALSQVIVRLYREPAKYAKVAGLDVKEFTDLLRNDANAALIQFLETLHNAGGMDVLSPMFADMGENGARAIQALSTLATHIDEVKAQQAAANKAFEEAISIDKEFNVQNNTVQAGLEKAKKNFNEMAVALGEKLAPVMKFAITSSSALMKVLAGSIDFFVKYRTTIISLTAGVVAYYVAVNIAAIKTKLLTAWTVIYNGVATTCTVVTKALTVVIHLLSFNLTKAKNAWVAMSAAMKLSPIGLVTAAVTALVAALAMLTLRTNDQAKAQKALNDIKKDAAKKMVEEKQRIDTLMAAANNMNLTYGEQKKAVDELNRTIPGFNGNIDATTRAFKYSQEALEKYNNELLRLYEIQGAKDKLAELGKQKAELLIKKQETKSAIDSEKSRQSQQYANMSGNPNYSVSGGAGSPAASVYMGNSAALSGLEHKLSGIESDLNSVDAMMKAIYSVYGTDLQRQAANAPSTANSNISGSGYSGGGSSSSGSSGGSSAKPDKFANEKSWREREIALNKIAWLTGQKDYEEYTNRMLEIESQYHAKRLAHEDLEGNEQVNIQAEFLEARKKQQEQYDKWTIEEENQAYEDLKRQAQEDYLKKRISTETYNMQMENIEFAHLRALTYITKEGTEERAKAEKTYREKLVADQQKRQAEFEKKEKEHQKKLEDTWEEYAVSQEEKRERLIKETEKLLEEMYKAKLALIEMDDSLTPEQKQQAIDKLTEQYKGALKKLHESTSELGRSLEDWIGKLFDKLFGEGTWGKYGETIKSMFASVTSVFSSLNQMADAENELRMARLEKYYEREISMAEGNAYKVKQIERKKQREEAKLKAEASKRQFTQQVLSAVAETALAAINAYASASKVSWILGPIAAAMAVAAGAVQIAAIKKQQAASLAQGFSKGGFTPAGRVDEPVGVVHAGEWVASQKLLKNPQTRPLIEALDFAQRNNTIGRLTSSDVSRTVTAPSMIAGAAGDGSMQRTMEAMVVVMSRYDETMSRLGDRLDEPFVTVNTVTGDTGIKRAQDEYQKLMNNTLPKNKRK